jgi:hypothetical protein
VIKTPRLLLFDRDANTQILEDFINTDGLKWVLFSTRADFILPQPAPVAIGHYLGTWLRSFHAWASAPNQAVLRGQMWQNHSMRKIKYAQTYGSFITALEDFAELLEGYEDILETFRESMASEFEKPVEEEDEDWGLLHADFWSGK